MLITEKDKEYIVYLTEELARLVQAGKVRMALGVIEEIKREIKQ